MAAPFVRSTYNYDMDLASYDSGLECLDLSLTVQDARDEVDINTIVRRFGLTGQLPDEVRVPEYGDFVGLTDYHAAMTAVAQANESFDKLPADMRTRFNNDPERFVDFCLDERNRDEMTKMGLLKPVEPAPPAAPGVPAEPAPEV